MKTIRLALIFMLIAAISACGGKTKKSDFFVEEEPQKKPKVDNQTKIKRNWRVSLGDKIDEGDAIISPALLGEYLYAASTNGRIEKISAQNGKRIWQTKLKKQTISAGVGVGDGLVLVATDQGMVYAYNQEDGSLAWKRQLSSEILASPVIDSDVVVTRTGDGKVIGMSSFDGEILWTISRQLPRLTLRGDSRPLLVQGVVVAGFSDGTLAAVEAQNGRALWDFPISFARGTNEIDRLSDIDTTPLLVGNNIYISSYQEITHSLNIAEQRIEWSADVSSFYDLSYDAAHLYISDKNGIVHQLNRQDGTKNWSQSGLRLRNVTGPISVGPYVIVSDGDGELFVISKTNGQFVGRHSLRARTIVGQPIVDSDAIYFIDSSGNLQSISIVN